MENRKAEDEGEVQASMGASETERETGQII